MTDVVYWVSFGVISGFGLYLAIRSELGDEMEDRRAMPIFAVLFLASMLALWLVL